jgi:N-acetylmuramoyl-L-alanine amidase
MKFSNYFNRYLVFLLLPFCYSLSLELNAYEKSSIPVHYEGKQEVGSISTILENGIVYVSLHELAGLTGIRAFTNSKNKKIVLRIRDKAIKVTAYNPFIILDGLVYQMVLPTIGYENNIYVPLSLFLEITGDVFPADLYFQPEQGILKIKQLKHNITDVIVEEKSNGSIVRISTIKEFQVSDVAASINKDWLYITLYGGILDSAHIASDRTTGIVDKIAPFQFEKSAQVSCLLNKKVTEHDIFINPDEIIVSLRTAKKLNVASKNNIEVDRKKWLINCVIIDPGHGGRDPGAIGKGGLKEKDVTLNIAKRLKGKLEKNLNVKVLMTRENDTFIALKERTLFANSNDGKLFVSIHVNANRKKTIRGFSTYFLGVANTQAALEVAELENSVIELEESIDAYRELQDAAHILNAIVKNTNVKESEDLARIVNKTMKNKLKIPEQGVYQAGFYVLVGSAMPTVLIETAHISNAYEEKKLRTNLFKQKIAEAIYESIVKFKEKYEKGIG